MNEPLIGAKTTRRSFLQTSLAISGAVAGSAHAQSAYISATNALTGKLHGVNLGAWLVLERWIVPSVFGNSSAQDEYTLGKQMGKKAMADHMNRHYETWITEKDFEWMKNHGINTVRLPIGFWAVIHHPPYPYAKAALERALQMAQLHHIDVLVDLHGAPGSQNGWDHSGHAGALNWTKPANIELTLQVIEELAALCTRYPCVAGIELLNEPRWDVPFNTLADYYSKGYQRVRKHLAPDQTAVVFHDGFRPDAWAAALTGSAYQNVILDTHLYQTFTAEDQKRNLPQQIAYTLTTRTAQLNTMMQTHRVMAGEWSLALPGNTWQNLTHLQQTAGHRGFGDAQLLTFDALQGWYFWTLKTEQSTEWSLQNCVKKGWFPRTFNA